MSYKFIENVPILKELFNEEINSIRMGRCPFCKEVIRSGDFKDELSKKEYTISGMCQKCQDQTFEVKHASTR